MFTQTGESKSDAIPQSKPEEESNEAQTPAAAAINLTYTTSSASEDYYQTVVIHALLGILKDQSPSTQHHTVIEAIMSIFKTQGLKCVTFLPQVRVPFVDGKSQSNSCSARSFRPSQL